MACMLLLDFCQPVDGTAASLWTGVSRLHAPLSLSPSPTSGRRQQQQQQQPSPSARRLITEVACARRHRRRMRRPAGVKYGAPRHTPPPPPTRCEALGSCCDRILRLINSARYCAPHTPAAQPLHRSPSSSTFTKNKQVATVERSQTRHRCCPLHSSFDRC